MEVGAGSVVSCEGFSQDEMNEVQSSNYEDKKNTKSYRNILPAVSVKASDKSDVEKEDYDKDKPCSFSKASVFSGHVFESDIYADDSNSSDENRRKTIKTCRNFNSKDPSAIECEKSGTKNINAEKSVIDRKIFDTVRTKTVQKIASETQTLPRDKRTAVSYKKPKQLTLDEFLKQRTEAKSKNKSSITPGTILDSVVTIQNDVPPVFAKTKKEKNSNVSKSDLALIEVVDQDNVKKEIYERPNVTGVFLPYDEKVGRWLEKHHTKFNTDEDPNELEKKMGIAEYIDKEIFRAAPLVQGTAPVSSKFIQANNIIRYPQVQGETINQSSDQGKEMEQKHQNQFFFQAEEELESFITETRSEHKRITLAERLRAMPGYEKIASAKPRIGGGNRGKLHLKSVIKLGGFKKKSVKKETKKEKDIQSFMNRFAKHASVGIEENSSKDRQHFIRGNSMPENSLGTWQSIETSQFDNETKSANNYTVFDAFYKQPDKSSPAGSGQESIPRAKIVRLREVLKEKIHVRKTEEYMDRLQDAEAKNKLNQENLRVKDQETKEDGDFEINYSEESEQFLDKNDTWKQTTNKSRSEFLNKKAGKYENKIEVEDIDFSKVSGIYTTQAQVIKKELMNVAQKKKFRRQIVNSNYKEEENKRIAVQKCSVDRSDAENFNHILLSQKYDYLSEQDNPVISDLLQSNAMGKSLMPSDYDLEGLCSGNFPSQAPLTPTESQDDVCFHINEEDNIPFALSNIEESDYCEDYIYTSLQHPEHPRQNKRSVTGHRNKKHSPGQNMVDDSCDKSLVSLKDQKEKEDDIEVEDDDDEEAAQENQIRTYSQQQSDTPKRKSTRQLGKGSSVGRFFFDDEAELSGSDDDSADEDENEQNHYEVEEGDQDEFDDAVMKNQASRVHLKQMLDQDDRDIRFLKEKYLERGNREDRKMRQRKFRWTNVDGEWGDEEAISTESDGEGEKIDPTEPKERKEEVEKRMWLLDHPDVMEACTEESQKRVLEQSRNFLNLGAKTQKKIESFVDTSYSKSLKETSSRVPETSFSALVKSQIEASTTLLLSQSQIKQSPISLVKKTDSSPSSPDVRTTTTKKGSFLSRGSPALTRLAERMTKSTDCSNRASIINLNSRNFVFEILTPPDKKNKDKVPKRPADSKSHGKSVPKKIKKDRSFNNLDHSSKDSSIFKHM